MISSNHIKYVFYNSVIREMTTLCARLIYQAWSQSRVVSLAMGLARKALDHGLWCAHR